MSKHVFIDRESISCNAAAKGHLGILRGLFVVIAYKTWV